MILGDFFKAIAQLGDSRFQRVVMLGIGLTIALLVAIYAGFLMLITILFNDVYLSAAILISFVISPVKFPLKKDNVCS